MADRENREGTFLSVIVPACNCEAHLTRCLSALTAALPECTEVIVVDDGSTDGTRFVPEKFGVRSIPLPNNIGRGPARNVGAREARGQILLFLDADVVVHGTTVHEIIDVFTADPACQAMFGSYDTNPDGSDVYSQYRNLLHHFVHQNTSGTAKHFWSGLGAVRREVFEQVGGFGEGVWANVMEEVDFGARLVEAGVTIKVFPQIRCQHLKTYTLQNMIKSDLFDRAIPWSRFMLLRGNCDNDFVASRAQRYCVVSAFLILLAPFMLWYWPLALGMFAAGSGQLAITNVRLFGFFRRERGMVFALKCAPLYWIYLVCCGCGFGWAFAGHQLRRLTTMRRRVGGDRATAPANS